MVNSLKDSISSHESEIAFKSHCDEGFILGEFMAEGLHSEAFGRCFTAQGMAERSCVGSSEVAASPLTILTAALATRRQRVLLTAMNLMPPSILNAQREAPEKWGLKVGGIL